MKRIIKYLLIVGLFLTFLYFNFFRQKFNVANDLHISFPQDLMEQLSLPSLWGAKGAVGMGEYAASVLWNWPVNLLFGIFFRFGLSYMFLIKLTLLLILGIGSFGIFKLFRFYKLNLTACIVGSIFYLANTYILLLIDGGQLNLAFAYAIFPLTFFLFEKAIEKSNLGRVVRFSISVVLLSIFDIRIVYLFGLLLGIKFVFDLIILRERKFMAYITTAFLTGIIFVGIHFYWILPSIIGRPPSLPLMYDRQSQVDFLSFAKLGHAIELLQPHWYKNVFGNITQLKAEFLIVPIIVFAIPFFIKKDRRVGFWLGITLLFTFLVKGANVPFVDVYPWLFVHVPGFSLFRDPTKFFFLTTLSFCVLLGIFINWLSQYRKLHKLIISGFVIYMITLTYPVWNGLMTGTFASPVYESQYLDIAKILKDDTEFSRVLWIPTKPAIGYSSSTHPSIEAFRLSQERPFIIGNVGQYEVFNFLREAPFSQDLLEILGVKYLGYPYLDDRRESITADTDSYYHLFLDQLTKLPSVKRIVTNFPIPLLEFKNHVDHFFESQNTWIVLGSDRFYSELSNINNFNLTQNALVFTQEKNNLKEALDSFPSAKIILYDTKLSELPINLISKSEFIFPANNLPFEPFKNGLWKRESSDLLWWRNFLQDKYKIDNLDFDYGGGWSVAEGSQMLEVANSQLKKDNKLFIRVMQSTKGGNIKIYQNNKLIGETNTKVFKPDNVIISLQDKDGKTTHEYEKSKFIWVDVGKLIGNEKITIKTDGEINVINSLVSVSDNDWQESLNKSENILKENKVIDWSSIGNIKKQNLFSTSSKIQISYNRLSPTHYLVNINNLDKPAILAFSEAYDPFWVANGQKSSEIYGLINGFYVDKNGQYDISYYPQKYVGYGVIITIVTVSLSSLTLFLKRHD